MSGNGNRQSSERDKMAEKDVDDEQNKKRYMKLMHEYNELKDATQVVLGAIANLEGVTVKKVHEMFKLPLKD